MELFTKKDKSMMSILPCIQIAWKERNITLLPYSLGTRLDVQLDNSRHASFRYFAGQI